MAAPKKTQKTKEDKDLCRIITPEFRVSYPHLMKAHAVKTGDKPKFSITMLFPKNVKLVGTDPYGEPRTMQQAITNAKLAAFGPKENWPEDLISPVTDGDDPKHVGKEGYAGHWVIKAISGEDQRPGVVDRDMTPITEAAGLYPGCYARAYVFAYAWEYMGKQGIGFILDHVQKVKDGKSFSGKKAVEHVFAPLAPEEESDAGGDDDHDFK